MIAKIKYLVLLLGLFFIVPIAEALDDAGKAPQFEGWIGAEFRCVLKECIESAHMINEVFVEQGEAEAWSVPNPLPTQGAFVDDIKKDSPASAAGLRVGDIVVKFGETPVKDESHLRELIRSSNAATAVSFEILRSNEKLILPVKLKLVELVNQAEAQALLSAVRSVYGSMPLAKITGKEITVHDGSESRPKESSFFVYFRRPDIFKFESQSKRKGSSQAAIKEIIWSGNKESISWDSGLDEIEHHKTLDAALYQGGLPRSLAKLLLGEEVNANCLTCIRGAQLVGEEDVDGLLCYKLKVGQEETVMWIEKQTKFLKKLYRNVEAHSSKWTTTTTFQTFTDVTSEELEKPDFH